MPDQRFEDLSDSEQEEQRDRYRELLEELRTIIPGVQVLFAFLLTVPFSSRFEEVDQLGRRVFAASLLATALASVAFITPAAYHRVAHRHDRASRLNLGIRLTILGMALLALSVTLALFVVVRFVFDSTVAGAAVAVVVGAAAVVLLYLLPISRR